VNVTNRRWVSLLATADVNTR